MAKSVQSTKTGRKRIQTSKTTEAPDIDLLKHLHLIAQSELRELQDRQIRIFTWSSLIFLFIIVGLLTIDRPIGPMWASRGSFATSIVSVALLIVATLSVRWQQRVEEVQVEVVETETKIEKLLHCYDEEYYILLDQDSLYPKRWGKSKNNYKRLGLGKGAFSFNSVFVTALLGSLAVMMLWLL